MTTPSTPQIAATGILAHYAVLCRRNAEQTAMYAGAVIEAAKQGLITPAQVSASLIEIIGAGAITAALLADLSTAADLSKRTGSVVPPLSLDLPEQYLGTIRLGVATVTEDINWNAVRRDDTEAEVVVNRVQRLARAVPLDAGQTVVSEALQKHGVKLWTRGTDANPCALCKSLADGTVFPITRTMLRHPSCACVQLSVLETDIAVGDTVTEVPDVVNGPTRTLTTGHGLFVTEYSSPMPGLRFERSTTRTSAGIDRYSPDKNGATEAARRANRARKIQRTPPTVISLDEYRKRKNNGR